VEITGDIRDCRECEGTIQDLLSNTSFGRGGGGGGGGYNSGGGGGYRSDYNGGGGRFGGGGGRGGGRSTACFTCHQEGHMARECPQGSGGGGRQYRD